jgi:glycosyltransferase involved in cell wall biosynthesis
MAAFQIGPAPGVSVAISTWNRAHLVDRAIRSALAQTFGNFELLVVDDGSTDATPEVLAGVDDGRLRRVRHERNYGISRTRNTALGLARGEWLAFLDDDNEWAPDYLERQLAFAASRPGAGVVYCRARRRDALSGSEVEIGELRQGRVFCDLVEGWNPFVSSALIRRAVLVEAGGLDEKLRATEDRDLWMRLAQRTEFAGANDVLLIRHERHGPQLSRNPDFLARDAAILAGKWGDAITAACGRRAYRRWQLRLVLWAERCHVERSAERGGGERLPAARSAGRLLRLLPGSAPHVAGALGVAILGSRRLDWVSRQLGWYRYRARKALGLSASR